MLFETLRRALTEPNILWRPTPPENHFDSNQICFYSKVGKVFPLVEFQAKLNRVGGFYRDSLAHVSAGSNISCSFRGLYFRSCAQVTAGSIVLGTFSAFCYTFCEEVTTGTSVWRLLSLILCKSCCQWITRSPQWQGFQSSSTYWGQGPNCFIEKCSTLSVYQECHGKGWVGEENNLGKLDCSYLNGI